MKEDSKKYSHLCLATFYMMLVESKANMDKEGEEIANYAILSELAKVFKNVKTLAFDGKPATQQASKFRSGDAKAPQFMGFYDEKFIKAFENSYSNQYQYLLERFEVFIDDYLYIDKSDPWLIYALFDIIKNDDAINPNDIMFIDHQGRGVRAEELETCEVINIPSVLLGIFYYAINVPYQKEKIKDAYQNWTIRNHDNSKSVDRTIFNWPIEISIVEIGVDLSEVNEKNALMSCVQDSAKERLALMRPDGLAEDLGGKINPETGAYIIEYNKPRQHSDKFIKYKEESLKKVSMKRGFLDTHERRFRDFYICNDVKQRPRTPIRFLDSSVAKSYKVEDIPSVENIKVEDIKTNYIAIVGTGGLGKSMMMIKFFLDVMENYTPGGIVPILITLKSYRPKEKNIEYLLTTELKRFNSNLKLKDLRELLKTGRAVCLLDGFDEISKEYRSEFQDELDVIKDGYPDNKYIISSRDIDEVQTLNNFWEYVLQPLSLPQAKALVKALDPIIFDDELKDSFIRDIEIDRFNFNRDEKISYIGNPLFISLMLRTYAMTNDIPEKRYAFYEKTYVAMSSEYDAKTKRITRPFATGLDEKKFHRYFSEFCALSYADSCFEFSEDLMSDYFFQVIEDNNLNTTADDFVRDVTEKLCILYRDGLTYVFIHRSFQEYFAACYFLSRVTTEKDTVLDILNDLDNKIKKDETLSMMYAMDEDVMQKYIILSYLQGLFLSDDDEENYKNYIIKYYPTIEYVTGDLDEDMCTCDNHESAIYSFIRQQFDIDHGYLSSSFECERYFADDFEEYFWIEENWFDNSANPGNMSLVTRNQIPSSFFTANEIDDYDDIECERGFLCAIDAAECMKRDSHNEEAKSIIMGDGFPLKKEFKLFRKLYDELNGKYGSEGSAPRKKFGLRKSKV